MPTIGSTPSPTSHWLSFALESARSPAAVGSHGDGDAGVGENRGGELGFSRAAMTDDRDVSDAGGVVDLHRVPSGSLARALVTTTMEHQVGWLQCR